MKVKELVDLLLTLDQESDIYVDDGEIWNDDAFLDVGEIKNVNLCGKNHLVIHPKYSS